MKRSRSQDKKEYTVLTEREKNLKEIICPGSEIQWYTVSMSVNENLFKAVVA